MSTSRSNNFFKEHLSLEDVIKEHAAENLEVAKKGYQVFIDQNYQDALPYSNLAGIYILEDKWEEALELSRKAITIDPEFIDAYTKLGCILEHMDQSDPEEIFQCYKKAIELEPENALAHFSLGNIYAGKGNSDLALEHLQQAANINPDDSHSHLNIGILYTGRKRYDLAAKSFKKSFTALKSMRNALCAHWHMRMRMCDWSQYEEMLESLSIAVEEAKNLNKENEILHNVIPFTFFNLYDDPKLQRAISELYIRAIQKPINKEIVSSKIDRTKNSNKLIKIAFLSADYHNHATAFLMAELFELFDKDKFEVHAISFDSEGHDSAMRKRIQNACGYFHDVGSRTDKEIAQLIADQNIDIAVDLKGYTQNSRAGILAYRPAPIQVNYLGYPGTMGADFIDYIIADPFLIPEKEQSSYSENIAYLPDSYQVNDRLRPMQDQIPSRTDCGLPEEGFIFCSFNNSYKITPAIFDVWMDLLREKSGSVLWLLEDNQWEKENLLAEAKSRGIDPSRLIFSGLLRLDYHLARIKNADLFLDTFPCNAHTTASDALWAGLPLVTYSGKSFASRVAGSLLSAMDLPELITTDLNSYKELAFELSHDPEKLNKIKHKLIKNRENCTLFDTEHYKNNLQVIFQQMIKFQADDEKCKTFYVSDLENKPKRNKSSSKINITPYNLDDVSNIQEISLEDVIKKHSEGDLVYAKKGYQAFIDSKSNNVLPYSNLASIYFLENEMEKAIELLKKGIEINPEFSEVQMKLGSLLEIQKQDGYINQAIHCYEKVIELNPEHAIAHFSLGNVMALQGQNEHAILNLKRAISLKPDYVPAYFSLGDVLNRQGSLSEAAQFFLEAVQINSSLKNALCKYWHLRMQMCDWSDYSEIVTSLKPSLSDRNAREINKISSPFTLLNIFDDPALHLEASRKYLQAKVENIKLSKPLYSNNKKEQDSAIKIAFLSADFYDHATSILMVELFELFDQDQFEIHAISFGPIDNSEISKRIRSACPHFHDVINKSDKEVAQLIADQNIDIAIDLKGFTKDCRPAILAYRPAPIQINYLGYPGSMGADFIDYIIADPFLIPVVEQENYSENIMYLPDSYQVNDRHRAVHQTIPSRESSGLPTDGFVFCCFNSNYKITPEVFKLWMELLQETPGSVLWLLENNSWVKNNLKKEAENHGINPERLVFAQQLPIDFHLSRIQNADLFLDTFPCNAHTTASDALWVGLPLLTCVGRGFASRVAGSLLKAAGIEELITNDLETYKSVALSLAHHPDKLDKIKSILINNRSKCALFDTEQFKNNLQLGFRHMVDLNKNGVGPETFYVSDLADKLTENILPKPTSVENNTTSQDEEVMAVNIALIFNQDYKHNDIFNEVAETLLYSFNEIGFNAQVSENTLIDDGINIIIGANLLNDEDIKLIPDSSILYNFEQITDNSDWMTQDLFDLFKRFEVWDYSKKNILALKEKGITRVQHVPIGYTPSLTRIPKAEVQDIDVLFYGSMNDRRKDILEGLQSEGLKVEALFGVYGAERDEYISRSKVIVNIHYYDSNIFEQVRISYLLANKKAVVSEFSESTDFDEGMEKAISLVPYDQIISKCCELVKSDKSRLALEENGFEYFKTKNTVEHITKALNSLGKESEAKAETDPTPIPIASKPIENTSIENINYGATSLTTPFISILIPTYNHAKYIEGSILSALNQNYPNFEVIVVDDGSTDDTTNVVKNINDPRLKLIAKAHSGAPATRNRCIAEATGDYFLWLDSDDELMPDVLTQYTKVLQEYPEMEIIYGDLEMFDDKNGAKQIHVCLDHHKDQHLLSRMLKGCGIPNGGSLVKKSIYNRYGGYDESFRRAHDYEFWCRVSNLANIKHSGMISYRYRLHDSNMSFGIKGLDHSFEAAIIKRACNRYGVKYLSPELDWSNENKAYAKAWLKIGTLLQEHHDYEDALAAFQQASKTVEDDATTLELSEAIQNLITESSQANHTPGEYVSSLSFDNKDLGINPLVSVIFVNSTQPDQLQKSLQSIADQTYLNWEAIVINNGQHTSIEPSERFQFIDIDEELDSASRLNTAVTFTKGSIICYLDGGEFKANHLELIVNELIKNETAFVYSKADYSSSNNQNNSASNHLHEIEYSKDILDITNYIPMNTWGHRRDLFEKSGLFDIDVEGLEDWEMLLRFSRLTDIKQISEATVIINEGTTTQELSNDQISKLYRSLYNRYPTDNDDIQHERMELLASFNVEIDQEQNHSVPSKINIGSGKDFKEDCLNIDISENSNPDVIVDLSDKDLIGSNIKSKRFGNIIFSKNKFDTIIANDVLEHIPDLVSAMTNCLNLLKVGGQFEINVPYDLSYGAWQDPTHVRAFNERSWMYYTDWYWYLGWKESRFDITKLDFTLSPTGTRMQQEEKSLEEILTHPRAVDSMSVILTKRLLTEKEKAEGLLRMDGV